MKTFKQYMKEAPHPADGDNPVDGDMMLGDLTSDAVVERLNAYVGAIADREYLNPEKAVAEMRQKLMRVGIHFGDVQFTEESGEAIRSYGVTKKSQTGNLSRSFIGSAVLVSRSHYQGGAHQSCRECG